MRYKIDGITYRVICKGCSKEQELDSNLKVFRPCIFCEGNKFIIQSLEENKR